MENGQYSAELRQKLIDITLRLEVVRSYCADRRCSSCERVKRTRRYRRLMDELGRESNMLLTKISWEVGDREGDPPRCIDDQRSRFRVTSTLASS